jgi:adenylate kinase family enzyme
MQRIVTIGTSCSGKTTLAKQLAGRLRCPHVELDALHWLPNWVERSNEEFRTLVRDAVTPDRWVVDGNYAPIRDIVWPRATSMIWLNYSFPLVFGRALSRTFRRAFTGEELYSGNRESLRTALFRKDSILWWVTSTHYARRKRYAEVRDSGEFPNLKWMEFRGPAEATRFLDSVS